MGAPAIVMGDKIMGVCTTHQIPNPSSGAPQPAPPLPFSAPITIGTIATVLIGGKPAAVAGCSGINSQPHPGLHPSDPFMAPPQQVGRIVSGSATVMIGGRPAATSQSSATCCVASGNLVPSVMTVLIG